MSSRPSPPHLSSAEKQDDRIGFRFYARLAGLIVAAGVVAMILLLVFFRAVYAWGILGAFIAFGLILLGAGWLMDRRATRHGA
jgi:hypothetical protein